MTDITELAQSLKAAAEKAADNFDPNMFVQTRNILALVEALEKAQQRIAELEDAEQKLCAANVTLDARAELAERQLAEMESRAVTVKLPDFRHEHFNSDWGEHDAEAYQVALREALTTSGIKVEAE